MRILALETSGLAGSVAGCQAGRVLAERVLDPAARSARTLAPAVRDLLTELGWSGAAVDAVAVSAGPGSFTGLRVGVTTAKVLAYAWRCRLVGVDTLESIAWHLTVEMAADRTAIVLDAGRGQVYAAAFRQSQTGALRGEHPTRLMEPDAWLASLEPGVLVAGPALTQLAPRLPPSVRLAPRQLWHPQARGVALAALDRLNRNEEDDPFTLAPRYLRPSAAEEKTRANE